MTVLFTMCPTPRTRSPRPRAATLPPFQRFLDDQREEVWRLLLAAVGPADAEDCFQETFIAALRAYPRLPADSNLRAWILTIANRKAIDSHRARARRAVPAQEIERLADEARFEAFAGLISSNGQNREDAPEVAEQLWEALRELPNRQRSAVLLRCLGDLPHREIAAAIGCSEEAARSSLHEGLAKLRKVLS